MEVAPGDGLLVWVLQGPRVGDNAQARALGSLVGGEIKHIELDYNWLASLPNVLSGRSLRTLGPASRSNIFPPWPDIVIGVGRRMAPIMLAIKARSDGKTKTVCIGRPRLPISMFDLVIATPQYGMPASSNVLQLMFPLLEQKPVPQSQIERLEVLWRGLPKPWIVAAIGGPKFPLGLGSKDLVQYGERLAALERETGGSVMIFSSPRSRADSLKTLARSQSFWRSDQVEDGSDLYRAAVHVADYFAVTSDSVSMIAEMCTTGRKVFVESLPVAPLWFSWSTSRPFARWLSEHGVLQPPRNVPGYVEQLLKSCAVHDLAEPDIEGQWRTNAPDYGAVKARVLSIIGR